MELLIDIERVEQLVNLFGNLDENIKRLENKYNISITSHSGQLKLIGETVNVTNASRAIKCLLEIINKGETLTTQNIDYVINMVQDNEDDKISRINDADCICVTSKGKPIKPKTLGQRHYVEAIQKNTITIGVGPAGTGKTYLAVALAVNSYTARR